MRAMQIEGASDIERGGGHAWGPGRAEGHGQCEQEVECGRGADAWRGGVREQTLMLRPRRYKWLAASKTARSLNSSPKKEYFYLNMAVP